MDLHKIFNSTDGHGLVCVQFLVLLGGVKIISKNTINEFFPNLSMQALIGIDDRVKLKFYAINNKNINNLLLTEADKFKTLPIKIRKGNFADHKTENQKFEDDVRNILHDFKVSYLHDSDHLTFPNIADEITKQAADELE